MKSNIKHVSQFKQELIILEVLNELREGYFLDIGCSDPICRSNTYILEKEYGWSGVCVDPRKNLTEKFKINRKCVFENSALFTHTGQISFSDLKEYAGVNDPNITDRLTQVQSNIYNVPCITFADLIKVHKVPDVIHYLSMDVEGAELLLLENFPFKDKVVLTASIEHNDHLGEKQKIKAQKILELMCSKGFNLYKTVKCDFIFTHPHINSYISLE